MLINLAEFEDRKSDEYNRISLSSNYFHAKTFDPEIAIFPIRFQSSMKTSSIRLIASESIKVSIDDCDPFICHGSKIHYFNVSTNSKISSIEPIPNQNNDFPIVKPIINITEYDSYDRPSLTNQSIYHSSSTELLFEKVINLDTLDQSLIFADEIEIEDYTEIGTFNSIDGLKNFTLLIDDVEGVLQVLENGPAVLNDPNILVIHNTETDDYFSLQFDYNGILKIRQVFVTSEENPIDDSNTTQITRYFGQNTRKIRVVTNFENVYGMVTNRNETIASVNDLILISPFQVHEFNVIPSHQKFEIRYTG